MNWGDGSAIPERSGGGPLRCMCGELLSLDTSRHDEPIVCPRCGLVHQPPAARSPLFEPSGAGTVSELSRSVVGVLYSPNGLLLGGGLLLLLTLTTLIGYWAKQTQWEEEIPRLEAHANVLIREGKWDEAARELKRAESLSAWLGQSSQELPRRRLEQRRRELQAAARLYEGSLSEGLAMATQDLDAANTRLAGRTLLLDTVVRRDDDGKVIADLLFVTDDHPVEIDVNSLALWQQVPIVEPKRVLMGVELRGLRRQTGRIDAWELEVDPASGVLITEEETLRMVNLDRDPELRRLARDQRSLLSAQ